MHTENVSEDGVITDGGELSVATYYSPCVEIMNADGYLRVVSDASGYFTETRVDHSTLINAGWTRPTTSPRELEDRGPVRDFSVHYGPGTFLPTLSFGEFCALPYHAQKVNIESPVEIYMRKAERLGGLIGAALAEHDMPPKRLRQIVILLAILCPETFSWVRQAGAWNALHESSDWAGEIGLVLKCPMFADRLKEVWL